MSTPSTRDLVGALAEPDRLQVFAAVAQGAARLEDIADRSGVPVAGVITALRRLRRAGLVSVDGDAWQAVPAVLRDAARAETPVRPPEDFGVTDPARLTVLRAFVRDGRIRSLPAAAGKRQVVLEHVASLFEPGHRYAEREVDAILRAVHPDYAALRRYLVDAGLMARDHGEYWRTGGWVDVERPVKPEDES